MAFVKRNAAIRKNDADTKHDALPGDQPQHKIPVGIRPSPLNGYRTTSSGVGSLDSYFGGHAGLLTGSSVLVEESGTTDFSGALLKFFAAEGIQQGHHLHIVGPQESWIRELPGLSVASDSSERHVGKQDEDRMKIAWRYESLGRHGGQTHDGTRPSRTQHTGPSIQGESQQDRTFCHTFDLAKRLIVPQSAQVNHIALSPMLSPEKSPFTNVIQSILEKLRSSSPDAVHRIVIPSIMSPAFYPPHSSNPENFLQFLHALRAILRAHRERVVAMLSIPAELYARSSGLVRWAEHLCDGVLELQPFPHTIASATSLAESGGARSKEDQPQGMLRIHKLPDLMERGSSGVVGAGLGEDLSFVLSRRKFAIRPFSLPPLEGEENRVEQGTSAPSGALGQAKKEDIDF